MPLHYKPFSFVLILFCINFTALFTDKSGTNDHSFDFGHKKKRELSIATTDLLRTYLDSMILSNSIFLNLFDLRILNKFFDFIY